MFHILLQVCLTEKQFKFGFNRKTIVFCCVWLSKASIDVVWLPQASIDEFFQATKIWNIWSGVSELVIGKFIFKLTWKEGYLCLSIFLII